MLTAEEKVEKIKNIIESSDFVANWNNKVIKDILTVCKDAPVWKIRFQINKIDVVNEVESEDTSFILDRIKSLLESNACSIYIKRN